MPSATTDKLPEKVPAKILNNARNAFPSMPAHEAAFIRFNRSGILNNEGHLNSTIDQKPQK